MGWEVTDFDGAYSPMADNADVYISQVYGEDEIEIDGPSYDGGRIRFFIPVAVMRAWLQEYEKWTTRNE